MQGTILHVLYVSTGIIGVAGNLIVVFVISRTWLRKSTTNLRILNQSLIDATAGAILVLIQYLKRGSKNMQSGNISDEIVCHIWKTNVLLWSLLMSSTYNILLVIFEQYILLVHCYSHRRLLVKKVIVISSLIFAWLIGPIYYFSWAIPSTGIVNGTCYYLFTLWPNDDTRRFVGFTTFFVQYLFPACVISYCHITLIRVVRKRIAVSVQPRVAVTMSHPGNNATYQRAKRNLFKTLIMVGSSFILCWTYNECLFFLHFLEVKIDFGSWYYYTSLILVYVNCCINPFIYGFQYREFQRACRHIGNSFKRTLSNWLPSSRVAHG